MSDSENLDCDTCSDPVRSPGRRIAYRVHKRELDRFIEQWRNTNGDEDQQKALVEQARVTAGERAVVSGCLIDVVCSAILMF